VARHRYHATAWLQFMLVSGEMETACASSTQKVQNLLLHDDINPFTFAKVQKKVKRERLFA
jgi:hypothetical protein